MKASSHSIEKPLPAELGCGMVEKLENVLLTDGTNRVLIHPPETYPSGGSGFHHRIDFVGGPFTGSIDASSYGGLRALRSFHSDLATLYETLKGEVRLPNSYENLRMSFKGDGIGHIAVGVEAHAIVQSGAGVGESVLTFDVVIDQTQLRVIIKTIERWVNRLDH